MLTLTNSLNIEGYTVFQDDTNSLVPPSRTRPKQNFKFYVLPETPAIAKDAKGLPIFSLIVYRRDEALIAPADTTKDVGGGILTFTVELDVPADKMKSIKTKLRSRVFGQDDSDPTQDVDLSLVNFLDGTVSVAVAGEGAGDPSEFVKTAVGTGKVSGIAAIAKP